MREPFSRQPPRHATLRCVILEALTLFLAAAPIELNVRYVLEVNAVPIASLSVSKQGDQYTYRAVHFLEEGDRNFERKFSLSTLESPPEVLTLLSVPALGCRDVLEERTEKNELLCVEEVRKQEVTGTIDGERFTARYDAKGLLAGIVVGSARWVRNETARRAEDQNPFAAGVAVKTGPLALDPPLPGAKWLTRTPVGIGGDEAGRTRCLVLAQRAVAQQKGRRLAVGLVVEEGRAYPHAWIVEGTRALDPSVTANDPALATRRYLEVPVERSGAFFLALFDGKISVSVPK